MKVLHLGTTDVRGGAARGAFWLHAALRERGVGSQMLVGRKYSDDPDVVPFPALLGRADNWLREGLDALPLRRYDKTDESYWTVGWVPRAIGRVVRRLAPDVVHVHWTGGGFLSVGALAHIDAPIVWTMRDMWPLTGGCHYTIECERYLVGCGSCPQLRSSAGRDLSRRVWQRKLEQWRGLRLWMVPISRWLADAAEASPLFDGQPVRVIPNGIDTRRFRPMDRHLSRLAWGIEEGRRCILYGAIDAIRDRRKGFPELLDALRHLGGTHDRDTELVVFGDLQPEAIPDVGLKVRCVGTIEDDVMLARLYEAADVMVAPSLQEAFGKTLVEAMACGTPVVAFDHGGPADIVAHRETGYLARAFSAEDLARGIAWCLGDAARNAQLGRNARARAELEFDIGVVAGRYDDLYDEVLSEGLGRAA